jgi:hypothetical protein
MSGVKISDALPDGIPVAPYEIFKNNGTPKM